MSWSGPSTLVFADGWADRLAAVGTAADVRELVADAGVSLDWHPDAGVRPR